MDNHIYRALMYALSSRLLSGEDIPVSDEVIDKVDGKLGKIEEITDNLDVKKPGSWVKVARHLVNRLKDDEENLNLVDFRLSMNELSLPAGGDVMARPIVRYGSPEMFASNDKGTEVLWGVEEGVYISERISKMNDRKFAVYHEDEVSKTRVFDVLGHRFWQIGDLFEITSRGYDSITHREKTACTPVQNPNDTYVGSKEPLKKDLIKALEKMDGCWTVLLSGKPGMGKSTLCWDLAGRVGEKCLILGQKMLTARTSTVSNLFELLDPRVVIVNDIDRMKDPESALDVIEWSLESADLSLLTANHLGEMPDAMKRPGRIDHIEQIEMPGEEDRARVRQHFMEVHSPPPLPDNDEVRERLDCLHRQTSHAHAEEIIRRASAFGWDSERVWDINRESVRDWESQSENLDVVDGGEDGFEETG